MYQLIERKGNSEIWQQDDDIYKFMWGDGSSWNLSYSHLKNPVSVCADIIAFHGVINGDGEFESDEFDTLTETWEAPEGSTCWDEAWIEGYAKWMKDRFGIENAFVDLEN